jgi:hypothetical protein
MSDRHKECGAVGARELMDGFPGSAAVDLKNDSAAIGPG